MDQTPIAMGTCVREIPPVNTVAETADLLRLTGGPVYGLLQSGKLKSVVIGGKRLVTGQSIAELLRKSTQETYAPTKKSPRVKAA